MHTAFALVRSLGHAASQSVKAVRHAVAVERYVLEAARAGHCRATALRYLEDELLDRASRGLCGDVRCAAGRARVRMAEADRLGSTAIPGPRTVLGELAARDWFESVTPGHAVPLESELVCFTCGAPMVSGMGCEHCAGRARHPSCGVEQPTLCATCANPIPAGQNCLTCARADLRQAEVAAMADVWAADQFGTDVVETAPYLCQHPNENRWELADGTLAVHCSDCGASMVGAEPGAYPFLSPSWVFADGTVVEDV